jgi:hypothetical protein
MGLTNFPERFKIISSILAKLKTAKKKMEEGSLVFVQNGHTKHKYFVKFKFSSHQTLLLQNIRPTRVGEPFTPFPA